MDRAEAIKYAHHAQTIARDKPVVLDFYKTAEAALREWGQSEWVSVKDRLPENGETVLVYRPTMKIQYMTSYYWYRFCDGAIDIQGNDVITHWMPLPEPPKED